MADYGVTSEGFRRKTLDELKQEFEGRLRSRLGADLPLIPQSFLGVITGELADMLSEPWAVAEALWFAFDETSASDIALDNLASITGSERQQAAPSTATLTATGDTGTVLPSQRVVSVPATGIRFVTGTSVTLLAVPAWQGSFAYAVGARVVTNNTAQRVYQATSAGASASSGGGPAGTGAAITDGTVVWRYLGEGVAAADVASQCTVTGPTPALAFTLTGIETPVSGWRSVTNVLDAALGSDKETDAALRLRRRKELRGLGNAAVAAIEERLSDTDLVPGVQAVTVFENDTDATNSDGMPPHSVEALVEGGESQAILDALWASKAAGIATYGTTSGTVTDSEGLAHTVRFTRPTILTIYETATIALTPDAPADDAQAIALLQSAQLSYGDALPSGRDVVWTKVAGAFTAIPWVADVTALTIGTTLMGQSTANIPVTTRQRADFDTSRMAFTLVRLTAGQL